MIGEGSEKGSLTVEALLILPLIILCLVLFIQIGHVLYDDLQQQSMSGDPAGQTRPPQPAGWIRKTDLLLDIGRGLTPLLPGWFR